MFLLVAGVTLLVGPGALTYAQSDLSVRLQPAIIPVGGTAELIVEVRTQGSGGDVGEPSLPDLPGVSVVGRSRASRVEISGMRVSRSVIFSYTLRADRPGVVTIPSLSILIDERRVRSQPLRLTIAEGARPAGDATDTPRIFATARLDRDSVYVGEQVVLTFAFYHDPSAPLAESPDYDPPKTPGFWRVELTDQPVVSNERIGGRTYQVQRFRYALFPLRAGLLTVGSARVRIVEPDRERWWLAGAPRELTTEPLTLRAVPLPEGAPSGFAGAVGAYELGGDLSGGRVAAGSPLELTLIVRGVGNPPAIAPPALPSWPDVVVHPPSVESNVDSATDQVAGSKTFRYLLVPEVAGRLALGIARFPYFDPAIGDYRVDSLALGEIEVLPAAAGTLARVTDRAPAGPTLWPAREPRGSRVEHLAGDPRYWAGLAGPWFAWLGWLAACRARRRRRVPSRRRWERQLGAAGCRLARGEAAALPPAREAVDALLATIEGDPARGAVYESALRARSELRAAAYGGGSLTAAAAAVAEVVSEARCARRQTRSKTGVAVVAVAGLVAVSGMLSGQVPEQRLREAWEVANLDYRSGNFVGAAAIYRDLLERVPDPHVEADLAAALWRAGQRGTAVAHYMNAVGLDPRATLLRDDLGRLRAELGQPSVRAAPVADVLRLLRPGEWLLVLMAANLLAVAGLFVGRSGETRVVPVVAVVVLLLTVGATALRFRAADRLQRGVVLQSADLQAAPGATTITSLAEGSVVEILERGADGWRVRDAEGRAGWVAPGRIFPVH